MGICRSRGQRLASALDDGLQRRAAVVLLGVQTFGMARDAMLVDQGEAEAALARCDDEALQGGEGLGQGADGGLDLMMSIHIVWMFLHLTRGSIRAS